MTEGYFENINFMYMYVYLNVYLCTMYRSPQRPEKAFGRLELVLQHIFFISPYIFLLLLKISASLFPLSTPHSPPLPLPLQFKEQSGFPALWEVQGPPPSIQV